MAEYFMKMDFETITFYENLNEQGQGNLNGLLYEMYKGIGVFVNKCKSPIEQTLAFYLIHMQYSLYGFNSPIPDRLLIIPQKEIQINETNYIADFLLIVHGKDGMLKIVVECDGHEFHEKTKEQAAHDKKRDRDLTKAGYKILHFTGSEIYKNPNQCITEILEVIKNK